MNGTFPSGTRVGFEVGWAFELDRLVSFQIVPKIFLNLYLLRKLEKSEMNCFLWNYIHNTNEHHLTEAFHTQGSSQ